MTITSVTVRFLRRVQIADYEPAEAEVTFVANLAEVITPLEFADGLLVQARKSVLKALGKSAPTEEVKEVQVAPPAPVSPQPEKRGPGRPRKHPAPEAPKPAEVKKQPSAPEPEVEVEIVADANQIEEPAIDEPPAQDDVFGLDEPAEPPVKKPASIDEFRREVYAIAASMGPEGAEKIRNLRSEYGVAQVIQVPEDKWVEFLTRAKALAA